MFTVLLILFAVGTQAAVLEVDNCPCLNGGTCFQSTNHTYCDCPNNFIDENCSKQSKELNQTSASFVVNQEFSYYHTFFNESQVYLARFTFFPQNVTLGTTFGLQVAFQNDNGTLNQDAHSIQYHSFTVLQNDTNFYFNGVIMTPELKLNGKSARLVLKLKQIPRKKKNQATGNIDYFETQKSSIIRITIEKMEYRVPELMQYMLLSFCSIFLLSCSLVALAICRRFSLIRTRRYRPAVPTNSISHFDSIMPALINRHFTQKSWDPEDTHDCMICLLDVTDTETRLTPCGHLFHKECIDEWGIKSLTCPACRSSLADREVSVQTQAL